jgi:hypothetical protein
LKNSSRENGKLNCPSLKTEGCLGFVPFLLAHSTMSTGPLPYSHQALSLADCPIGSSILSSHCHVHIKHSARAECPIAGSILSYHCHIHIAVSVSPEPSISWYRDDEQVEEIERYRLSREALGTCHMDICSLEIIDQVITDNRYTNNPWGAGAWLTDPVYFMTFRVRGAPW